ncbi:MAG: hypothetical protein U0796_23835 [Gemmatales bacterium]
MRLTLRGLLAYLDDRLDPAMTAQVGDHVQEHDKLRQLTDRIKRVLRRRRLSTPDLADKQELPVHHEDDPNEVAAFLDGAMTYEQEADFEQICIDTDVYLAEVAACHQIMTSGTEAYKVPPLARQRMYGLVKGPEAQPQRVLPREAKPSKPPLWEVTDSTPALEDENQALLEPLYHTARSSRWGKALMGFAALLVVGLLAYILWSLPRGQMAATELAETLNEQQPDKKLVENEVEKVIPPAAPKPVLVDGVWPVVVVRGEGQTGFHQAAQTLAGLSGLVASRPALPFNVLLGLGDEPTAPVEANTPIAPLPALVVRKNRLPAPERTSRAAVAMNGADAIGMFFQQNEQGEYRLIKPGVPLVSNEKLMALPGYSGNISLANGLRLLLLGQFHPSLQANPFAEALVELHPTMEAEVDLTLHRGRMVVLGRSVEQGRTVVRLRFCGESWEVALAPGAELGIQARGEVLPGEGDWQVEQQIEFIVSKGIVDIQHEEQKATLKAKQSLMWKSTQADKPAAPLSEMTELPVWLARHQTAVKEAYDSLVALRARTHAKLDDVQPELKWFSLACEETLDEGKLIDRQAAILGLTILDRLQPVLALANNPSANGRRKFSHEAIQYWLNQEADRAGMLLDQLREVGYSDDDAKLLLALYRGVKQSTPLQLQALVRHLGHERVAIREQAWRLLSQLAPERPNIFDPVGPEDQRTKAISIIRGKLLEKMSGDVPPP